MDEPPSGDPSPVLFASLVRTDTNRSGADLQFEFGRRVGGAQAPAPPGRAGGTDVQRLFPIEFTCLRNASQVARVRKQKVRSEDEAPELQDRILALLTTSVAVGACCGVLLVIGWLRPSPVSGVVVSRDQ